MVHARGPNRHSLIHPHSLHRNGMSLDLDRCLARAGMRSTVKTHGADKPGDCRDSLSRGWPVSTRVFWRAWMCACDTLHACSYVCAARRLGMHCGGTAQGELDPSASTVERSRVFMGVARHLRILRCKGSSWRPCPLAATVATAYAMDGQYIGYTLYIDTRTNDH